MGQSSSPAYQPELKRERWELLARINALADKPMIALAILWLALLLLEFTRGPNRQLQFLSDIIWVLFILDFCIEIVIAPDRKTYLRHHWITALSLVLPALRIFRVLQVFQLFRIAPAAQTLSLLRVVTSLNRSMSAISRTLGRHGFGYVIILTIAVTMASAAALMQVESPAALRAAGLDPAGAGAGFQSFGESLWWSTMILMTVGSEYWPKSLEGRLLTVFLSAFGFAIFGYIAATLASYFLSREAQTDAARSQAGDSQATDISVLREEIAALRAQMTELLDRLGTKTERD